jgi:hypothetical protein
MSLRSWAGFLPEKTVVMVRRRSGGPSIAVEHSADPAESIAQVASITASLKQNLLHGGRTEGATPAASRSGSLSSAGSVAKARVLVYFEAEPSNPELEFLLKMMSAIQLGAGDLAIEFGDFPEARATVAVGIGLGPKKAGRLHALRPDGFDLPALSAIQQNPAVKREAWEKLKQLAVRLKEFGG